MVLSLFLVVSVLLLTTPGVSELRQGPRTSSEPSERPYLQLGTLGREFMYKRGSSRHTWHPTLRALGVAAMRRGGRLDVQEHTRNARSRRLA
mgnify:CR=1 FL=1